MVLLLLEVLAIILVYGLLSYGFWLGISSFGKKGKLKSAILMVLLVTAAVVILALLKWLIRTEVN